MQLYDLYPVFMFHTPKMIRALLISFAFSPIFTLAREKHPVDFTGVDAFWNVTAKIKNNSATDADWDAMFATPYYKFYAEWNQRKYMQRTLTIAFDPSMIKKKDSIINLGNWYSTVFKHLQAIDSSRSSIEEYRRSLEKMDIFTMACDRADDYLPDNLIRNTKDRPDISFGLFQPDGNASSTSIVMDLKFASSVDVVAIIAHEVHHFYTYNYRTKFNEDQSSDAYGIIKAITQLQLEGIADLIDKTPTPADDLMPALKKIDSLLVYISKNPESKKQNGLMIRDLLPRAGHPHGHYMAQTILKAGGNSLLLSTLKNPFDFIRTYNSAIEKLSAKPTFSKAAMDYLALVEKQERL